MAKVCGTFTNSLTGNQSFSVGDLTAVPYFVRFFVSGRTGTDETVNSFSTGSADTFSHQKSHATFRDGTGAKTRYYSDRCINHFWRPSSTIDNKIQASFVSFDDNGGGDYGFTLNFTNADANFPIEYELEF